MAGFKIFRRIPETELRASAVDAIRQIEDWFEKNPKRRVCRTELWYDTYHSIKRKDVHKQIDAIVESELAQ